MTHDEMVTAIEGLAARVDALELRNKYLDASRAEKRPAMKADIGAVERMDDDALAVKAPRESVVGIVRTLARPMLRIMPAHLAADVVREAPSPVDFLERLDAASPSSDSDAARSSAVIYRLARHHAITWSDLGIAADGTVAG